MTKKTTPAAQAQSEADKADREAGEARGRARTASESLEAARAEYARARARVGSGEADAEELANVRHRLSHAEEVAQAAAEYAEEQEGAARLARLAGVAARIVAMGEQHRAEAARHMMGIVVHVRSLIEMNAERNTAAAAFLAELLAEEVTRGGVRDHPREEDAGLMIEDHRPARATTWIRHPGGKLEVRRDIAGAIVANALAKATEGNPHQLAGRVNLLGKFDRGAEPVDVVRAIYGD